MPKGKPNDPNVGRPDEQSYRALLKRLVPFVASEIANEKLSPVSDGELSTRARAAGMSTATHTITRTVRRDLLLIPEKNERYETRLKRALAALSRKEK